MAVTRPRCRLCGAVPGAAALMLLAGLAGGPARAAQPITGTIGGVSPGGFFALIGTAIGEMVAREYPGSSLVYEPGNQAGQLVKLAAGRIDLAIASPMALHYAAAGRDPFPAPIAAHELQILAQLADNMTLFVIGAAPFLDAYHIRTLGDFARVRPPLRTFLAVRGNLLAQALMIDGLFRDAGLTEASIASWGGAAYFIGSGEAKRLMQDRKLDLYPTVSFHPDAKVLEISRGLAVRPVPVEAELLRRTAARFGLPVVKIPAGTYAFLAQDYAALAVPMYLVASARLPEATGYRISRALYRQMDYYHALHPALAGYAVGRLADSGGFPRHPGARRFYREAGLLE